MKHLATGLLISAVLVAPVQADWVLDGDNSALSFVSTKAINIAEVHRFAELDGRISDTGEVDLTIALASVDTGIELRDERMREMLFDTANFGTATVAASLDMDEFDDMAPGDSREVMVDATLTLHGESKPLPIQLLVTRAGATRMLVTTAKPVVVNAPEFKLAEGVERLREVAGLPNISTAVPVTFVLTFDKS